MAVSQSDIIKAVALIKKYQSLTSLEIAQIGKISKRAADNARLQEAKKIRDGYPIGHRERVKINEQYGL